MTFCLGVARHLLVPLLFHDVASLHPPSFHRNDFYTCSTNFPLLIFWRSPNKNDCAVDFMHAHAHADNHTFVYARRSVASRGRDPRSTIGMYGERKLSLGVHAHLCRRWRRLVGK